jgi:hypothetical protein
MAKNTQNVSGADVTAAEISDVDSVTFGNDKSVRNRAEEITYHGSKDISEISVIHLDARFVTE